MLPIFESLETSIMAGTQAEHLKREFCQRLAESELDHVEAIDMKLRDVKTEVCDQE